MATAKKNQGAQQYAPQIPNGNETVLLGRKVKGDAENKAKPFAKDHALALLKVRRSQWEVHKDEKNYAFNGEDFQKKDEAQAENPQE